MVTAINVSVNNGWFVRSYLSPMSLVGYLLERDGWKTVITPLCVVLSIFSLARSLGTLHRLASVTWSIGFQALVLNEPVMFAVLNSESEQVTWYSSTCAKFKSSTMLEAHSVVEWDTEMIIKLGPLDDTLSWVVPSHLFISYSCSWKVVLVGSYSICWLVSSSRA